MLADSDGVISMVSDRLDAATIAAAPRLRAISNCGVGVDNIDLAAATARGIPVGHTPGVLTETTAELAFALMIAVARRIVEADRYVREGRWKSWGPGILLGRDLFRATLGLIGFGQIGQAMARRARGFEMRLLVTTRGSLPASFSDARLVALDTLLTESDFISIHAPLTAETRHLVGAAQFAQMKPGAILVNTARGQIVDHPALVGALASGHLGGAGLDVTEVEPLPADDPILALPNVVLAPHIGSASHATRNRMAEMTVANLLAVFDGKLPPNCANPAVAAPPPWHAR